MNIGRDRLFELLAERSVKFGEFKLASGKTSNVYVDVRQTSLDGEGATLIGDAIWRFTKNADLIPSAFGGLTLGADPLVTATAMSAFRDNHPMASIIVRKATKSHGTGQRVEMPRSQLSKGDSVIALDDVATTGGSTLEAIQELRAAGFVVEHAICVVDRQAGAKENLANAGVTLHTLFGLSDFVED